MSDDSLWGVESRQWPIATVRGDARAWLLRLAGSFVLLVVSATLVRLEVLGLGVPMTIGVLLAVGAFISVAVCGWVVTAHWRTSIRSDGNNLVVREPLGARVVPLSDALALHRFVDVTVRRPRPVVWVMNGSMPVARLSERLTPVVVEAFAHCVGVPLIDVDDPPHAGQ